MTFIELEEVVPLPVSVHFQVEQPFWLKSNLGSKEIVMELSMSPQSSFVLLDRLLLIPFVVI